MTGSGNAGRPAGLPKTGGRTKGTPNKSTLALREKLAAWGCDPADELLKLARDSNTDVGFKVTIYALLLRYSQALPKAGGEVCEDPEASNSPTTPEQAVRLARYILERFGRELQPESPKECGRPQLVGSVPTSEGDEGVISDEGVSQEPSTNNQESPEDGAAEDAVEEAAADASPDEAVPDEEDPYA
jgi:hypothetical protein